RGQWLPAAALPGSILGNEAVGRLQIRKFVQSVASEHYRCKQVPCKTAKHSARERETTVHSGNEQESDERSGRKQGTATCSGHEQVCSASPEWLLKLLDIWLVQPGPRIQPKRLVRELGTSASASGSGSNSGILG
ncbi:Hypothetical predicted protein, partial [Pelobates cultripes]